MGKREASFSSVMRNQRNAHTVRDRLVPFNWWVVCMWVVVLFVWVDAVLFFLRVPTPFHRLLFKAPMLWVFMGLLVVFPARLMVVGVRDLRSGHRRAGGWINAVGGGMALLAVGLVMGAPMVKRAMEPKVTKNRSTPTAFVPQTGLPVFPGAEGFGTRTPAGREGARRIGRVWATDSATMRARRSAFGRRLRLMPRSSPSCRRRR